MDMLTPNQVATRVRCGRSSVMRALKSGDLPAKKGNRSWQIAPEDADRWASGRLVMTVDTAGHDLGHDHQPSPDIASAVALAEARTEATMLREQIGDLRDQIGDLRDQVADARADKERWQAIATAPRPSLIDRIRRSLTPSEGV